MTGLVSAALIAFQLQLFNNIWPPRDVEAEDPPPPPVSLQGVRDASCGRDTSTGNIFSDTAVVRGQVADTALTSKESNSISAARISQKENFVRSTLGSLLDAGTPNPEVIRVELAYQLIRLNAADLGTIHSEVSALVAPMRGNSDALYIQSLLAASVGRDETAIGYLNEALALDPTFYNAAFLRGLLLLEALDNNFQKSSDCDALFTGLVDAILPVATLGACPLQLAHFQLALERRLPPSKSVARAEFNLATNVAIAFLAQKDAMHTRLLNLYYSSSQSGYVCRATLQQLDFGYAMD